MQNRTWLREALEQVAMIVLWSSGFHCIDAWVGLPSSWFAVVVQIALFGILAGTVRVGLRSWQRRRAEHGTS